MILVNVQTTNEGVSMIKHVIASLGRYAVYFVGGAYAEISPPQGLSIGDEVEISLSGVTASFISSMRWTGKDGERHFIRYDFWGNTIR